MDNTSMNHYEKQLYTVFKTFDVDNQEALDKCAVLDLCDALQLEDRGTVLVDTLFERSTGRVTFAQFRNGLLSVLGAGETPAAQNTDPAGLLLAHPTQETVRQTQSDDDSSGREVAPKFVRGSKKYGRRSRPHRSSLTDDQHSPRAASESRLEAKSSQSKDYFNCKLSMSMVEDCSEKTPSNRLASSELDHDRKIDCEQALHLCRDLRMDGIDRRLVERIFEELQNSETTVGEFFDRLNISLTTSITEAGDGSTTDGVDNNNDEEISCDLIVDMWEQAGVRRPRRLLVELGFTTSTLRPPDLERALDAELRALTVQPDDSTDVKSLLLQATLALGRLRLEHAKCQVRAASAERDKLRVDLAEANHRAQLLAQDVDENHARIETELKTNLRQLEVRHAETMRVAAAEWTMERERLTATRTALEAEALRRADTETRLRLELEALHETNEELMRRVTLAEERTATAERERTRLVTELQEASTACSSEPGAPSATSVELALRLDELRLENKLLRDRNDELCAELEAAARRACAAAEGAEGAPGASSWRDEAAAAGPTSILDHTEECDSSMISVEQKSYSQIEIARRLRDILENTVVSGESSSCNRCGELVITLERLRELCEAFGVGEPSALRLIPSPVSATVIDAAAQTEQALVAADAFVDDKRQLEETVKQLEESLERMKTEYDKCEEYWSGKLQQERELHDEEQRLGDERLAELAAKIGDYERQFAPRALPPIDERRALEAQVTEVEEEFARYRGRAEAELGEQRAAAARLAARLAELERPERAERAVSECGACGACGALAARCRALGAARAAAAREAAALRARVARAEGAAARLHARLAAADLLVKDLYVENCHLAHHQRAL